jgi:hypothetical protein
MLFGRIIRTAVFAGGSFALALAVGLPATSNAVDDASSPMLAKFITPKLTVDGVELTIVPDGPATQPSEGITVTPGQGLKLHIRAVNTNAAPASGNFQIHMMGSTLASMLSRVPTASKETWQDSGSYSLSSGASEIFDFTTAPITDGKVFNVEIVSKDQWIRALHLSPAPASGDQVAINQ